MLEKLSSGLKEALSKITRIGYIDKGVVDELIKDLQRTLISGDVDVKLIFELSESIKKRALGEKPKAMTAKEHIINIVYEELVKLIGEKPEILLKPGRILVVGLFGSGKTTSIGKLAKFYVKKGLNVGLIGCDIHRPAAMDQLVQIGEQAKVSAFAPKGRNIEEIIKQGMAKFKDKDILIFDSSGRNALDKELAEELVQLNKMIKADEILLVIPADLGQAAKEQANEFKKLVGITGIFLTKMDGTARGGGAITGCAMTGASIKFIGTGEKLDALEVFEPERFISRLIGFGDLKGLIEKAKEVFEPEKTKEIEKRVLSGKFTLTDFYEQLKGMGKLGLRDMVGMMPGVKMPKKIDISEQEEKMKKWKVCIESMTPDERDDPDLINVSRISRVAKGSGVSETDVRELLKNYKQAKKVMKMISGGKRGMFGKLLKKFKL